MKFCAVKGCFSYDKDGSNQRFFKFPTSFERACLWHEFCHDPSQSRSKKVKRYICDKHFLDSDFDEPDLLQLKKCAIPSVNGPDRTILMKNDDERNKDRTTISSACKRKSSISDPGYEGFDSMLCNMLGASSLSSSKRNNLNSATSYKKSKLVKCVRTSPDVTNIVVQQSSNTSLSPVSFIKSYEKINSELKLSLLESVGPTLALKQKEKNSSDQTHLKTYKHIQKDLEVKLQPQKMFLDGEIEEKMTEHEKINDSLQINRKQKITVNDCAFENLDITLNSTLVFDSANISFTPNMINKTKAKSEEQKLILKGDSMSSPNETHSRSLKKQLQQMSAVHRKKLNKYRSKLLNNKPISPHLDVNDPKYSIAAIAESLGTFNSFVEEPIEKVDLEAGEWWNLYEPSEIQFAKLPLRRIGPIVNKLRNKLPTLNNRDKLEVSFLLSMMSVYPSVPKHIKEILSQRLNLVYIATMFEWNTAISLGLNVYKKTTTSNILSSKSNSTRGPSRLRNKTFQNQNISASTTNSVDLVQNNCANTNDLKKIKSKIIKPLKSPQFAFEIIVQEKSSGTIQNESLNTSKEL